MPFFSENSELLLLLLHFSSSSCFSSSSSSSSSFLSNFGYLSICVQLFTHPTGSTLFLFLLERTAFCLRITAMCPFVLQSSLPVPLLIWNPNPHAKTCTKVPMYPIVNTTPFPLFMTEHSYNLKTYTKCLLT